MQSQQTQRQVVGIHFRERQLFRLVDVSEQQFIEFALFGGRRVLYGQKKPVRDFCVGARLRTQSAEAVGADAFG